MRSASGCRRYSASIADAALTARVEPQVLAAVGETVGETLQRPDYAAQDLQAEAFPASPAAMPFRHLWLGEVGKGMASVVMVDDLSRADALALLEAQAKGIDGVRWVDRTSDFSALLKHYRKLMSALLLVGIVLVFAVLYWRYRAQAWRVFAPTLAAGALTTGLLGLFGQPLQLFNVLALMLLLGMGIDYGIFLIEHRGDASAAGGVRGRGQHGCRSACWACRPRRRCARSGSPCCSASARCG